MTFDLKMYITFDKPVIYTCSFCLEKIFLVIGYSVFKNQTSFVFDSKLNWRMHIQQKLKAALILAARKMFLLRLFNVQ